MPEKTPETLALAIQALMLIKSPVEGDYRVMPDGDEFRVMAGDVDFWDDSIAHEFEASVIASLCNLGMEAPMDICQVLDALQVMRPSLYE